jgi:hypothetical protein
MTAPSPDVVAEIGRSLAALWFDIDHNGGRAVTDFCTADASFTFDRRTITGHAAIAAEYATIAADPMLLARHIMTNLTVALTDDGVWADSVVQYYSASGPAPAAIGGPTMVGDVIDRWVRGDSRWLLADRRIKFVFVAPNASFPIETA